MADWMREDTVWAEHEERQYCEQIDLLARCDWAGHMDTHTTDLWFYTLCKVIDALHQEDWVRDRGCDMVFYRLLDESNSHDRIVLKQLETLVSKPLTETFTFPVEEDEIIHETYRSVEIVAKHWSIQPCRTEAERNADWDILAKSF